MKINELVQCVKENKDCLVLPPGGLPIVDPKHLLPDDVEEFYSICGGINFFSESNYSIRIASPGEFLSANPKIIGKIYEDDISSSWYIAANDGNNDFITIDLSKERNGKCYDSFFDRHAVAGSCSII